MKKEPRARQFMYVQDLDHLKIKESDLNKVLKNLVHLNGPILIMIKILRKTKKAKLFDHTSTQYSSMKTHRS